MASDPGPVVHRALLTAELQRLRHDANMTQEGVARALDWSASKLIRIEGGTVRLSTTDLHALLRHYGVADEERIAELSGLARGARERGWWTAYKDGLEDAYSTYLGYETGASFIRWFSPLAIPGLLQTEDYARALTIEYVPEVPVAETVIEVRMQRQDRMLNRENGPQQHYIIDEAVVRRRVGGQRDRGIMPRQLAHLLNLARRPDITIELIPFEKGAHFGMRGEFTILEFEADLSGVLFLENTQGPATVTDSEEVASYLDAFDHLRQLTLREDETIDFIKAAAAAMNGGAAADKMDGEDAA